MRSDVSGPDGQRLADAGQLHQPRVVLAHRSGLREEDGDLRTRRHEAVPAGLDAAASGCAAAMATSSRAMTMRWISLAPS